MFLWYERAAICYAYLRDVPDQSVPSERRGRFNSNMDWNGESNSTPFRTAALSESNYQLKCSTKLLCGSKWFTRGWTLQELIAPRRVVFYSRNWYRIGPHRDLMGIVSSITGITKEVISHETPLSAISIATRMSWAAQRKTTRNEDIAYCLLGIFGVTMPLIYGEGYRAFQRLQEEIMKRHNDQSLFAWGLGKKISIMDLHMPHPVKRLKEKQILSDIVTLSGVFAQSPKDFEHSNNVSQLNESVGLGNDEHDYPLPPMLMGDGLRIELSTLCAEDLALPSNKSYKGRHLCRLAYEHNLVAFAVLKCSSSSHVGSRIVIPLIAWTFDSFVRFGRPLLLEINDFTEEFELQNLNYAREVDERRKTLFIKAPPQSMGQSTLSKYEMDDYWSIPFEQRRTPIQTFAGKAKRSDSTLGVIGK
jgi:hypothetical protein